MPRKEKTTKHSYDAAPEGVDAEFKHVTAEERKKKHPHQSTSPDAKK